MFRGFGIKEYRISGLTHKVDELHKLGQQLSASLGINYFDEANTSEHRKNSSDVNIHNLIFNLHIDKVRHVKHDIKDAVNKLSTTQLSTGMGSSYSIVQ